MEIGFIGFGSLGKQLQNFLLQQFADCRFTYFDDSVENENAAVYPFKSYKTNTANQTKYIIALGYKHLLLKKTIVADLLHAQKKLFTFIHPTCFINPLAILKEGVIVYPMCNIDNGVILNNGVLINNSVTISHDCTIGSCTYISPGVVISGNVQIGESCFIGAATTIANNISIGNNVAIGIGTVVTKDIPDNSFVIGNPMRFVNGFALI